ncbi:hypothetical protein NMG60_11022718 [Bertholletia excelsa]
MAVCITNSVVTSPSFRRLNFNSSSRGATTKTSPQCTPFKMERHSITASHISINPKPQNPVPEQPNLFSAFHSIKGLVSVPRDFHDLHSVSSGYLQNGGIGMALLSVTSTAKGRISPFVATLSANKTFVSGLFAWAIAQSIKVILNFVFERKWDLSILFASGGMPSSHTALCMALTTSVAICHGVADSLFPVCLGFSLIVMYDAIGVRRHAGMQAEVLNVILEDLFQEHPISQRKLKELLGHTLSQVLAGALLGIMVACICCQGCFAAT